MPLRYQGKPRCIRSIFTVIVIANFLLCSLRQRHFTPLFRAHRFLCGSREHSLRSCQPITEAEPPYREAPVLQTEERPSALRRPFAFGAFYGKDFFSFSVALGIWVQAARSNEGKFLHVPVSVLQCEGGHWSL